MRPALLGWKPFPAICPYTRLLCALVQVLSTCDAGRAGAHPLPYRVTAQLLDFFHFRPPFWLVGEEKFTDLLENKFFVGSIFCLSAHKI
jgi:hypothetical protein